MEYEDKSLLELGKLDDYQFFYEIFNTDIPYFKKKLIKEIKGMNIFQMMIIQRFISLIDFNKQIEYENIINKVYLDIAKEKIKNEAN